MKRSRIGTSLFALVTLALVVMACSSLRTSSPTAAFLSFYEASRSSNTADMKKYLSKGSLDMMEKLAKTQNESVDDFLKEGKLGREDGDPKVPEIRDEKIDGDKATLDVRNVKANKWETIPFVKEDGGWKIALDKVMQPDTK